MKSPNLLSEQYPNLDKLPKNDLLDKNENLYKSLIKTKIMDQAKTISNDFEILYSIRKSADKVEGFK
jgi:hypothetical protein